MTRGSLGLQNATNARDLGGLPTGDGGVVRRGVLFRANALNRLTEGDLEAVGRLKLASLIDFRHPHEVDIVGVDRLPNPGPSRIISLPLFDPEHDLFTTVSSVLRGNADVAILAALRSDGDGGGAAGAMIELYRWFVTADLARRTFAEALRVIATREALPLLFHCTAGKDRTGWLAAVVLSILGVDRALIIDDYLSTNAFNAATTAFVLDRLARRLPEPELVVPLLEARPEYIDAAFAEAERGYGGMDGYLRDGLGLDDEAIVAVRANLLA